MGDTYLSTFNNVGKKQSSFTDALDIAEEVLSHEFDTAEIAYNSFVNVVSYKPIVSLVADCRPLLQDLYHLLFLLVLLHLLVHVGFIGGLPVKTCFRLSRPPLQPTLNLTMLSTRMMK